MTFAVPNNHIAAPPGARWYVAQTKPKRERIAEINLVAIGVTAFCPTGLRSIRHARKIQTVRAAFFPGYLFVFFDMARDKWRSVNGCRGVSRLVAGGDGAPIPAPRGVVEALINLVDESGLCRVDRDLREGQKVRIAAGPFAEMIGRLVRLDPQGRAEVLLEMLGAETRVELERRALAAA